MRRQRKVLFMRDSFIGSENKHSAVAGIAESLQRLERDGGKKNRCGRKPCAILLQDAVPCRVWITRYDRGALVGESQIFERLNLTACRRRCYQNFMDCAVLDRECILGKAIENIIGNDNERTSGFLPMLLSRLEDFKFQNAGADEFMQISICSPTLRSGSQPYPSCNNAPDATVCCCFGITQSACAERDMRIYRYRRRAPKCAEGSVAKVTDRRVRPEDMQSCTNAATISAKISAMNGLLVI